MIFPRRRNKCLPTKHVSNPRENFNYFTRWPAEFALNEAGITSGKRKAREFLASRSVVIHCGYIVSRMRGKLYNWIAANKPRSVLSIPALAEFQTTERNWISREFNGPRYSSRPFAFARPLEYHFQFEARISNNLSAPSNEGIKRIFFLVESSMYCAEIERWVPGRWKGQREQLCMLRPFLKFDPCV